MSWDLFLNNLDALNDNLSATSKKKNEVYNILVEHNKSAELDFIIRLTSRKINKIIKKMNLVYNLPKENFIQIRPNTNKDSLNIKISAKPKVKHESKLKSIEKLDSTIVEYKYKTEVGAPVMGGSTSVLYNLHI